MTDDSKKPKCPCFPKKSALNISNIGTQYAARTHTDLHTQHTAVGWIPPCFSLTFPQSSFRLM